MKNGSSGIWWGELLLRVGNAVIYPIGYFLLLFWGFLLLLGVCSSFSVLRGLALAGVFLSALSFSLLGHLVYESSLAWREYPYWVSHSHGSGNHWRVTISCILTVIFLFLIGPRPLVYMIGSFLLLNDLFWFWQSRYAEVCIRRFRDFLEKAGSTNDDQPFRQDVKDDRRIYEDVNDGRNVEESRGKGQATLPVSEPSLLDEQRAGTPAGELNEDLAEETVFLTQTRFRSEPGIDCMTGFVRVDFEENATVSVVHLGICPPMETIPEFETEQESGDDVEVRVTQKQPFGIRLEVKRVLPIESRTPVRLAFFARSHDDFTDVKNE